MAKAAGGGKPRIRVAEKADLEELVDPNAGTIERLEPEFLDPVVVFGFEGIVKGGADGGSVWHVGSPAAANGRAISGDCSKV